MNGMSRWKHLKADDRPVSPDSVCIHSYHAKSSAFHTELMMLDQYRKGMSFFSGISVGINIARAKPLDDPIMHARGHSYV